MIPTSFEAEQRAASEGALLQTRGDLGALAVTGKDRLGWLNGLVTCEVGKLTPGGGAYGLAVGKTGKIMSELWFLAAEDRVLMGLPKDRIAVVREHFDRHLIMEDAEMSEPLDQAFVLAHGPRAAEIVATARELGADAAMIDWTGRRDAAVILAPEGQLDAVLARAAERGGVVASDEAWEAIRIAWGVPRAGVDFDDQTLPQEASLEKVAVCFNKGCYLGQETVFMLEKRGHAKKKLMRLFVEGDEPVPAGAELAQAEDGAVGSVTSAAPALDGVGWNALGFVKYKHAVVYKALTAAGRAARVMGSAGELRKAG